MQQTIAKTCLNMVGVVMLFCFKRAGELFFLKAYTLKAHLLAVVNARQKRNLFLA